MLMVAVLAAAQIAVATPRPLHLEAEAASLKGTTAIPNREGTMGTGYVTGFDRLDDEIEFTLPATAGIYRLRIRYRSPYGPKQFGLSVNGEGQDGLFDGTDGAFSDHDAGLVELRDSPNTLEIRNGWGYFDIDSIDFLPAQIRRPRKPPKTPVDPLATPAARKLMRTLVNAYGSRTFSGQYGLTETDYVLRAIGCSPAILGGDFMDYSPSRRAFGTKPQGTTERMIRNAKRGSIVTMVWHWNAPKDLRNTMFTDAQGRAVDAKWYRGFYTEATTFDVAKALDDPSSEDYRLLLRDIDAIAGELKKFSDAGVPVLWRPLHEAEGGWFWWGAKGPAPFKKLWRLMFDRLTKRHGLHNLIWVYTGEKPDWYPGDAFVDVVGIDAYPSRPGDPKVETWGRLLRRFDGKKLLALTEYGGVPDVERMRRFGASWAFFATWNGDYVKQLPVGTLRRMYRSEGVVTKEELIGGTALRGVKRKKGPRTSGNSKGM